MLAFETMSRSQLLACSGEDAYSVVIGGLGGLGSGAGLFLFDGEQIQKIDELPTAGIQAIGTRLSRLLCSEVDPESSGELLIYDDVGVERYFRIAHLPDAHDLTSDGQSIVCTATGLNTLVWVSPYGELIRSWKAPGENDAWHLNGLAFYGGKIYFSAFGMFARHREWNEAQRVNPGVIYNWSDQRVEVAGLDCPHNPNLLEEGWVVCNSGKSELLNLEFGSGVLKRRLQLSSWTRGFACSDSYYFVGESANRKKLTVGASAHLCIIDRRGWQVCDRFALPVTEIGFIALVHNQFVGSLRRGFRTNPYRENVYNNNNLLRTAGTEPLHILSTTEPLPLEALKVRIQGAVKQDVVAGSKFQMQVSLENLGTGILASSPPCPVHFTYSWFASSQNGEVQLPQEGWRTRLSRPVPPGYSLECDMTVIAPAQAGTYRLHVSLIQEWIARFEDVDPNNSWSAMITVQAKPSNSIERQTEQIRQLT